MVQMTQNMMDNTDIRPMGDHLEMFQHIYRDLSQEADHVTHVAREKGATRNSNIAVHFFDGGVNIQYDDKIKHKVESAYVIQSAEKLRNVQKK